MEKPPSTHQNGTEKDIGICSNGHGKRTTRKTLKTQKQEEKASRKVMPSKRLDGKASRQKQL
jgi:hypothetical protein